MLVLPADLFHSPSRRGNRDPCSPGGRGHLGGSLDHRLGKAARTWPRQALAHFARQGWALAGGMAIALNMEYGRSLGEAPVAVT
jgi:hypothetical protein